MTDLDIMSQSQVQTHYVSWYAPTLYSPRARAVCGTLIDPAHQSAHPTCPHCDAWLILYHSPLDTSGVA